MLDKKCNTICPHLVIAQYKMMIVLIVVDTWYSIDHMTTMTIKGILILFRKMTLTYVMH